jgi:hypothetical protein
MSAWLRGMGAWFLGMDPVVKRPKAQVFLIKV